MRISDWSSDVCSSDLPGGQDGEREQQHQPRRGASCLGLVFEEVHSGAGVTSHSAAQNSTFGAARTCSCCSAGISSNAAGAKLNMPATMLEGNTSRLLL